MKHVYIRIISAGTVLSVLQKKKQGTAECIVKSTVLLLSTSNFCLTTAISANVHVKDVCSLILTQFQCMLIIQQYMSDCCVLKKVLLALVCKH